ncbi:TPA: glycosyltransferase family 2 protein [Aeromonas sobria]|nr:glycosyltransferase family 2 protein [Aeromonas sobria]
MYITVFTPTYNRADTLIKLYESLCMQSVKCFEWLIVDDGSTDITKDLIDEWCSKNDDFNIKYIKVDNGGKHRAINTGVKLASGEVFFIVDSDDWLIPSALESIGIWFSSLVRHNDFAGVAGLRGYNQDSPIGGWLPEKYIDATALQRKSLKINGDKAEAYFTSVLKRYPFPEIKDEKFITESVVWNRIARDGLKIRWTNEIIYVCNYLDGGLTKSGRRLFVNNPKGYAIAINENIKDCPKISLLPLYMHCKYVRELREKLAFSEMSKLLGVSTWSLIIKYYLFDWIFKARDFIKMVKINAKN